MKLLMKKCSISYKNFVIKFVAIVLLSFCVSSYVYAGDVTIGRIARNIMESFKDLGELMIAMAYLSGFGFTVSAVFKFKQHKDNPTQIPVSTPLALLFVGIVLIFLPGIIKPTGFTIFGTEANLNDMAGGFTGDGAIHIPGGGA